MSFFFSSNSLTSEQFAGDEVGMMQRRQTKDGMAQLWESGDTMGKILLKKTDKNGHRCNAFLMPSLAHFDDHQCCVDHHIGHRTIPCNVNRPKFLMSVFSVTALHRNYHSLSTDCDQEVRCKVVTCYDWWLDSRQTRTISAVSVWWPHHSLQETDDLGLI